MTSPGQERDASSSADLQRASGQIAARLSALGIRLDGNEAPDELTQIADAVERFEDAVEAHGGDLMVDEPPAGTPGEPDAPEFMLPRRDDESVASYIARVDRAAGKIVRDD